MDGNDPFWVEQPFDSWRARWDLIQRAAFSPHEEGGEVLSRGEVLVSINFLASRWGWTTKRVRGFMNQLERLDTLSFVRRSNRGSVYRVTRYEEYQDPIGHTQTTEKKGDTVNEGTPAEDLEETGHTSGHPQGHTSGHPQDQQTKGLSPDQGTPQGTPSGIPKGTKGERRSGEGKRENEGGEKKKARKAPPKLGDGLPDPPPTLDTPELRTALMARIMERQDQQKRFHVTAESLTALYRQLERVVTARGIDHAIFCLYKATESHNQGVVFASDLKPDGNGSQGHLFKPRADPAPQQGGGTRRRKF